VKFAGNIQRFILIWQKNFSPFSFLTFSFVKIFFARGQNIFLL